MAPKQSMLEPFRPITHGRFLFLALPLLLLPACARDAHPVEELMHFPADSMANVVSKSGVELDQETSSDGGGSLKITVKERSVVRLYETSDVDVEDARLIYQAQIKTQDVDGKVYLEMWCSFPGRGEFFSRGLNAPLTGTTDWTSNQIAFFLKKGENPDNVKLNLVIEGKGTIWVDDVRLIRGLPR